MKNRQGFPDLQISIQNFLLHNRDDVSFLFYLLNVLLRETNLLYDSLESSSANQQRVATVVSHELAHQWFGNLVTLNWWDDLW